MLWNQSNKIGFRRVIPSFLGIKYEIEFPVCTVAYRLQVIYLITYCIKLNLNYVNPILHTAWLDNHALTLRRNTAKFYFGEKSSFLHTFLKICCESRKIEAKLKDFLILMLFFF
jgi:hypothetical protein